MYCVVLYLLYLPVALISSLGLKEILDRPRDSIRILKGATYLVIRLMEFNLHSIN